MPIKIKKLAYSLLVISYLFSMTPTNAAVDYDPGFDPNLIISDYEMHDYQTMSFDDIQSFLDNRGTLGKKALTNKDGIQMLAADIIYQASRDHQVNPRVLLATLQKEQSLVEDASPQRTQIDWAMGYAICDGCTYNDSGVQRFKGFGKQVNSAACQLRYYSDNPQEFTYQVGHAYNIDGQTVIIYSQATANLYNYTPHLHGNYNFWQIWQRWFTQFYPDGSLLQAAGSNDVWLIQNNLRRSFAQISALVSRYDIDKIITVNQSDLEQYSEGKPIRFTNYSLLEAPSGAIYLLVDETLRGFTSAEIFRKMGYNWSEVEKVSWEDLADYQEGKPITINSIYPLGALLQNNETGGVYYVEEGIKYPIWSKEIMDNNFVGRKIAAVAPDNLIEYTLGDPVKFKDGELVKSANEPTVYFISNGQKRPIISEKTFEKIGYKWDNIIVTDDKSLSLHPTGEPLSLEE